MSDSDYDDTVTLPVATASTRSSHGLLFWTRTTAAAAAAAAAAATSGCAATASGRESS